MKLHRNAGEEVHDGSEVQDATRVAGELAEVEEFGDQCLCDVFVFADLFFVGSEHIMIFRTRGAGERHCFEVVIIE